MKTKNRLVFFLILCLGGCTALTPMNLPNPLEQDKGINTDVQIAQNANMTKKKQLVEANVNTSSQDTYNQKADKIEVENTNINPWLIGLLVFLAGMAIPTRSQHNMIKKLKEDLEYERTLRNDRNRYQMQTTPPPINKHHANFGVNVNDSER